MRGTRRSRGAIVSLVGAAALFAACGAAAASASGAMTSTAKVHRSKGTTPAVRFPWGTFHLSSRIEAKVKSHQTLNFVLSYPYLAIAGGPAQFKAGAKEGAALAKKKYGLNINTSLIGTTNADTTTEVGQITSGLKANQFDCLGVTPVPPGAFDTQIASAMKSGVPVFTVNTDSPTSHRIAYFGADDNEVMKSPLQMGRIAGKFAIKWAHKHGYSFNGKTVALITGDATADWARGRMKGFVATIKAAYPKVTFTNTPTTGYSTGFDPATVTADMTSYMTGHPNVSFYFDTDWGSVQIGQLILRKHLQNKVYTLGYNLNAAYVQLVKNHGVIGTIDQRYDIQARNWVLGCARLIAKAKKPRVDSFVRPSIWTSGNIGRALKVYAKIPHSGVTG